MSRLRFFLAALCLAAVLFGSARPSLAQGAPPLDAGAGESTYGCVESVPKGAGKPVVTDAFPSRGTSGWAVTLSITVRHGKGERVLPSGLDLSSAFEAKKVLKQAGFAIPDPDGGAAATLSTEAEDPKRQESVTHLELPLVPLPPGPGRNFMTLPPLPVAVARANGEIATVCTRAHTIAVEDPIANTPEAMPKDNPPALVQREEWTALKKALLWIALGLALGGLLAYLLWRKLTAPKPVPPPPPPRPPWEVAFEQLAAVRQADLLGRQRYGEYFDRTSDALRSYLGARFGFDGLESTTDEILSALARQGAGFVRPSGSYDPYASAYPQPGVAFDTVAGFLRECDLVKFANLTPTPEQCATALTTAEAIVRATMPISRSSEGPQGGRR